MNSYNENLHSSVVNSLLSQELDLKKVNSEANAAMFALYYAEESTISAEDKLQEAKEKQHDAEKRKRSAVDNSNISINLQSSAKQVNQYMQQSITNTAVAASNVQVAANSILRLASDIGSVFNIVQAANLDTDIWDLADDANTLITKSAYAAELSSQIAMEASVLTSQVSASMLLDKSKATNSAMNDLLKIITADYDAKSQVVSTSSATLASESVDEKAAEGNYEDINTVANATGWAYEATNQGLNLGLVATPEKIKEHAKDNNDKIKDSTSFNVQFDWIRSPFREPDKKLLHPVQDYYIIVVKDKQKNTFSINNAEDIIQRHPGWFIHVDIPKNLSKGFNQLFNYLDIKGPGNSKYVLHDSDGDEMTTGVRYTVFVMAVYQEEYKKKLNTFDDFLSAPSASFMLTYHLSKAKLHKAEAAERKDQVISFQVAENPDYVNQVEYRCILLPVNKKPKKHPGDFDTIKKLATTGSLKEIDTEIEELESIATRLDPAIALANNDFLAKESKIELAKQKNPVFGHIEYWAQEKSAIITRMIARNEPMEEMVKWCMRTFRKDQKIIKKKDIILLHLESPEGQKEAETFISLLIGQYTDRIKLKDLGTKKAALVAKINDKHKTKIGFLFNLALAEQVSAGNYIPAGKPDDKKQAAPKHSSTKAQEEKQTGNTFPVVKWEAIVQPGTTTDNFGNLLVDGQLYIPVILSYSTADEYNLSKFSNSWTGYDHSYYFHATGK